MNGLKITIEQIDGWWDWTVKNDPNSRGAYCGTAQGVTMAYEEALQAIQSKARNPHQYKIRTENK